MLDPITCHLQWKCRNESAFDFLATPLRVAVDGNGRLTINPEIGRLTRDYRKRKDFLLFNITTESKQFEENEQSKQFEDCHDPLFPSRSRRGELHERRSNRQQSQHYGFFPGRYGRVVQ